jgi:AhpD family alkylhydroperoxidase
MTSGSEALFVHTPGAAYALGDIEAAAWEETATAGLSDLAELMSGVCGSVTGLAPLAPPMGYHQGRWAREDPARWRSIAGLSPAQATTLGFAEQFSTDVSSIAEEQRRDLTRVHGDQSATVVATMFAMDFLPRTYAALDAIFDAQPSTGPVGSGEPPTDRHPPAGLWGALDLFTRMVPQLDAVDPVTTELVRLRGARQHQCRICASLRSRPALVAGADEDTFSSVDDFWDSDLSSARKAALALTDAMVWTPGSIDDGIVDTLVETATAAQRVELVLDITRNALNKVAVALGADAPHVESGFEIFDVDTTGNLVYGLHLG